MMHTNYQTAGVDTSTRRHFNTSMLRLAIVEDQPEAALLMVQTWLRDNFVVGFDELPFPGNTAG